MATQFTQLLAQFEDITINGVPEVGIAAGAEKIHVPSEALYVAGGTKGAIVSAIAVTSGMSPSHVDVRKAIIGAAYFIAKEGWFDARCNVVMTEPPFDPSVTTEVIQELMPTPEDCQKGLTLLTATKVNWWQQNHHVGQGGFQGYAHKVVHALFGDAAVKDDTVYQNVWKLGHWADTVGILGKLGVEGLGNGFASFPAAADDVKLRVKSYPAGTAKVGICVAIVRRAVNGIFSGALPVPPGLAELADMSANIMNNPVAFHVGASFLRRGTGRQSADIDEDLIAWCSAYVHALAKSSTISKAKGLLSVDEIKDHVVYKAITNIQVSLLKSNLTTEEQIEAVRRTGQFENSIAAAVAVIGPARKAVLSGRKAIEDSPMPPIEQVTEPGFESYGTGIGARRGSAGSGNNQESEGEPSHSHGL